jgi:hypothetical protein
MNTPSPAIQNLARRLIALEAAHELSNGQFGGALRTCDKLRAPLARLAGMGGFRSLMARALALATAEVPGLKSVLVRPDGSLEGFDAAQLHRDSSPGVDPGVVVVAQLLGLLVTFIGEPLTLHLVRDAWPNASFDASEAGSGKIS